MNDQKCRMDVQEGRGDNAGRLMVSGVLDFETILMLNQSASDLFARFNEIKIDLSGVTYVNSAGLALLLEWKRKLNQDGKILILDNVPKKLVNLARMSELETILFQ